MAVPAQMNSYLRIVLLALMSVTALESQAADPEIDDLLSLPPSVRLEQATSLGDLNFIASPECSSAVVGGVPAYFLSEKGNTVIDSNCQILYGKQGAERYGRLRQYAWDYNRLLLKHMKMNGLFNIWPSNTSRQRTFTSDEKTALEARGKDILHAIFGQTLPPSLRKV